MTFGKLSVGCGLLALAIFATTGCAPKKTTEPTAGSSTEEHAHEHEHGEHGAHGGHMLHLEPDGAHAEWTHDDTTKVVTVFLEELPAPPKEVKFIVKAGDTEPQTYPLVKEEGGTGGGAWTINSDALLTHLAMGEAAQIQLVVVTDDNKEMSTKIEHSDEEHHHH
ncbi:MAG: hypothetical protein ACTHK7_18315 [Aureliella sp.]